jgi:uncharacterized protein YceK
MRLTLLITLLLAGCGSIVQKEDGARFRQSLGKTTVTVYPSVVRTTRSAAAESWNEDGARQIAAYIEKRGWAHTAVATDHLEITGQPGVNQAKMFRSSMTSFGEWVKAHPPETEYACVAEYLMMGERGVGGVHVYCARKDGTPAFASLANSHWEEFKEVKPRTVDDATKVAVGALERRLASK